MQVLGVVIPKLEELQQRGRRRPAQDHPVHALPHDRPRHAAGHRPGVHLRHRSWHGVLLGRERRTDRAAAPRRRLAAWLPDHPHPGRRHRRADVDGRADHQRGIGNGMSMIIFASVVSSLPGGYYSILAAQRAVLVRRAWSLLTLVIIVAVVYVELGQRRIPVQFAKRVVGRRMMRRPEHLHPAEGQPVRRHPDHLRQLDPAAAGDHHPASSGSRRGLARRHRRVRRHVHRQPARTSCTSRSSPLLIIAFAYFYNSIAFDPIRQADQMRRQGGFIPGVRPGPQTERYLAKAVNRITLPGAVFIAFIAILPYILLIVAGVSTFAVRRHQRAHLGRCGARADAPDRQPAHAAQLRGIPQVGRP